MPAILYRSVALFAGDGRTVYGVVMPYEQTATVSDYGAPYKERFQFGAFSRSISERGRKVKLFTGHETNRLPIGRATKLAERYDGLHAEFLVAKTRDGDDALALVAAEIADAFSVGFRPVRDYDDHGVTVRTEAALLEVSLVGLPAYTGATVAGIRSAPVPGVIPRTIAEARLRLAARGK
jgi:HK97 family phage prohead protease